MTYHRHQAYKGIALFTPGGDLIYGCTVNKSKRWHLDLCQGLQELLHLRESPHFLIPSYTATLDQWVDTNTGIIQGFSEVYPLVQRHIPLLSTLFGTKNESWMVLPWQESYGDPRIIESYRDTFPELWENHNLVVNLDALHSNPNQSNSSAWQNSSSYVLRLFVSGPSQATTQALTSLHQLLEQNLTQPYTLKVVDLIRHPDQAEKNQISATPTLVRVSPKPVRRIVGEWDNLNRISQMIATT